MFSILPIEIIESICAKLDAFSISNFIQVCSYMNCLSDDFFKIYCHTLYGPEFWKKALMRPKEHHSLNWKKELYKIETFQKMIFEIDGKRWSEADFFRVWFILK